MTNIEKASDGRRQINQYTAAERSGLLAAHAASGKSKREFCEEHGINLGTFYGWRKAVRREATVFAEVEIGCRETEAPIEVELPHGVRIRVRTSGDVDRTARLIRQVLRGERPEC